MLITIAWRNIWRSRARSLLIIGAIVLGVWALAFINSWITGIGDMYIAEIINNQTSHIQIHTPTFLEENESEFVIPNSEEVLESVKRTEGVKSVVPRIITSGIINSPRASKGVMIKAVDPKGEAEVTDLKGKVKEGEYFDNDKLNAILIGQALADKLKIKVGKKISLQYQDMEGELTGQVYRIIGLYRTGNTRLDERIVYTRINDFSPVFKNHGNYHEMAVVLNDIKDTRTIAKGLQIVHNDVKVQTYEEVQPMIKLFETQFQATGGVITFIVMIALIFGIINTMLMAVLERIKELGILMAIGMNRIKIFGMIVLETLMLSLVGLPVGVFLGFITVTYLNKYGIDLSAYEDSLAEYGMSSMIYPSIDSSFYLSVSVAVFFTALLASIYPAFKATRLRPIEAINKI
ncbi:MAG: ABC-type lipoprotein release transport system permease subunit [Saprospiraceae bacterium]|jgi:ABC-type lipoprotein release transport system permease subunit